MQQLIHIFNSEYQMSERMCAAAVPEANAIKCISFGWHIMILI